jgi:hypothetical protein
MVALDAMARRLASAIVHGESMALGDGDAVAFERLALQLQHATPSPLEGSPAADSIAPPW